jgi:hypothetical protein
MPEVTRHLNAATLRRLESPEEYLGSAEIFREAQVSHKSTKKKER